MEERLTELEIRYMALAELVRELNEVVCRQGTEIELLEREAASLRDRLRDSAPGLVEGGEEEPPPHY
jgi:SlyX protein